MNNQLIKRAVHILFIAVIVYAVSQLGLLIYALSEAWAWVFGLFGLFAVAGMFVIIYALGTIRTQSKYFNTSFVFAIASFLLHMLGFTLFMVGYKATNNPDLVTAGEFTILGAELIQLCATFSTLTGLKKFHEEKNNNDLVGYAKTTIIFFFAFYIGAGILEAIVKAIYLDQTVRVVITLIDLALSIFAFVVYCIFLKKTEKSITTQE